MKILVVHNKYIIRSGEESVVAREVNLLREHGHHVILWEKDNRDIRELTLPQQALLFARNVWSRKTYAELHELCRRQKPDIAHFHNVVPLISPSAYYACQDANVPVVQTLHNYRLVCANGLLFRDDHPCEKCLIKGTRKAIQHRCYRNSLIDTSSVSLMTAYHRWRNTWNEQVDAYIAPSTFVRDKILKNTRLEPEKIIVKPHFIDDPGQASGGSSYALYFGRISSEKGVRQLIGVWKKFGHRLPLLLVGDGPDLIQLLSETQTHESIRFLGHKDKQSTLEYLQGAGFVILPSNFDEPFALTVLEAMACGKPILTTAKGGIRDLITPDKTGIFFDPSDTADLEAKINWMLTHPKELKLMGLAARQRYETSFMPEDNYQRLFAIYNDVIQAHSKKAQSLKKPEITYTGVVPEQ